MPYTSLKLEESSEYHQEQEKRERPKFRFRGLAVVCVVFFIWRVSKTGEVFTSALISVLVFAIGVPILMALRWIGAKFEAFGDWLVNRTKR